MHRCDAETLSMRPRSVRVRVRCMCIWHLYCISVLDIHTLSPTYTVRTVRTLHVSPPANPTSHIQSSRVKSLCNQHHTKTPTQPTWPISDSRIPILGNPQVILLSSTHVVRHSFRHHPRAKQTPHASADASNRRSRNHSTPLPLQLPQTTTCNSVSKILPHDCILRHTHRPLSRLPRDPCQNNPTTQQQIPSRFRDVTQNIVADSVWGREYPHAAFFAWRCGRRPAGRTGSKVFGKGWESVFSNEAFPALGKSNK